MMAVVLRRHRLTNVCEDFFTAVCSDKAIGGVKEFPGDDIVGEVSRLGDIEETIFMDKLVQYAMPERRLTNLSGKVLASEMQMGKFFLSCYYRDDSTDDARKFLLSFLDDLGIPLEFRGDKQYLSMFSALVRLSLVWGINNPLLFIELKPVRASKHYVTVIRTLKKKLDISKIDVTVMRKKRAKEEHPSTSELRKKLASLVSETLTKFKSVTGFGKLSKVADIVKSVFKGDAAIEEKYLREMVMNYESVKDFLEWRLGLMDSSEEKVPLRSYFNVLEKYEGFPWRQAINYAVKQSLNFSFESYVYIDRPDISKEMAQLLMDARFHRVFRNYLYVWLIEKLRFAMGKEPEEAACAIAPAGCAYRKEEKERYCFRKVSTVYNDGERYRSTFIVYASRGVSRDM